MTFVAICEQVESNVTAEKKKRNFKDADDKIRSRKARAEVALWGAFL
jgi:hypothetical protein